MRPNPSIPMHTLLQSLSGGDRRSVGESNRVVSLIFENPELIGVLFQGLETSDPVLRMRCADVIEKVTAKLPGLLVPHKKSILQLSYTHDRSSIVKTMSMQALVDIALRSHRLAPGIKQHIEELSVIGTAAMKARSKKLLLSLAQALHG